MMRKLKRHLLLAVSAAGAALALAPAAAAQPDMPDPPGYVPSAPDVEPGSFSYPYNVIAVGPPPATDSRGTRISSNADKDAKSTGLPGSSLGNSEQAAGLLTTANARYGISAGMEPPGAANPGIDARAGIAAVPSAEDPSGKPPSSPEAIESSAPDELSTPGGYTAPILETPGNPHTGVAGLEGPPLA